MNRKLLVVVIGMMAMFLAATTFAAEKKSGTEGEGKQFGAENLKDVENLKGKKVMEANGKKIGEVNSMLVDIQSGKVKYIMLTSGGVFGVGGEDYLIPWQALRSESDQQGFQVNLTSEELKDAPKGAEITSRDQVQKIHEFFGVSPE